MICLHKEKTHHRIGCCTVMHIDLPERRGESGQPALPDGQEPLVQRRQQTHRGVPVPLVLGEQPHPLPSRRLASLG